MSLTSQLCLLHHQRSHCDAFTSGERKPCFQKPSLFLTLEPASVHEANRCSVHTDELTSCMQSEAVRYQQVFDLKQRNRFSSNTSVVKSIYNVIKMNILYHLFVYVTGYQLSSCCHYNPLKRQCGDWFHLCLIFLV